MRKSFLIAAAVLLACSCGDNKGGGDSREYNLTGHGVFVCSEGNYNDVNASLSFYDYGSDEVYNDIYYYANGKPLGDVCSSMSIIDGKGYVVVNNSGKIAVIDLDTFKKTGEITGLNSPRYLADAGGGKLYVTNLYSSSVTVVDRSTLTVTGSIDLGTDSGTGMANSSEAVAVYGGYAYICSWSYNNKVFRINISDDSVADCLEVANQPNSCVVDRNGKLWVLSDGGYEYEGSPTVRENAALTKINLPDFTIEGVYVFSDINSSPSKLCINGDGSTLYFLNSTWAAGSVTESGVYSLYAGAAEIEPVLLIPQGNKLFYGLGVDPQTSDIYVSDAGNYVERGTVYKYDASGRLVGSFTAGIIPGSFCFKR